MNDSIVVIGATGASIMLSKNGVRLVGIPMAAQLCALGAFPCKMKNLIRGNSKWVKLNNKSSEKLLETSRK